MAIPSSQKITVTNGGAKTVPVSGDFMYTQVSVRGRNTGNITATARPLLDDNNPASYQPEDFEFITDGKINLAATDIKRTFSINTKLLSALRFADDGAGTYIIEIKQWNRAATN